MKKLELKTGSALILVAHPDDETIWMGGTILKFPDVRWTIFSLCRGNDRDRAPKFRKVCALYGASSIISDLEDEGILSLQKSLPEIKKRLWRELPRRRFQYIFTHGSKGEYGHPRHIGVHRAIKKLIQTKELTCRRLFYFAYETDSKKKVSNSSKAGNLVTQLTRGELRKKRDIVKNLYGFSSKSFENVSCLAKETFRARKGNET